MTGLEDKALLSLGILKTGVSTLGVPRLGVPMTGGSKTGVPRLGYQDRDTQTRVSGLGYPDLNSTIFFVS